VIGFPVSRAESRLEFGLSLRTDVIWILCDRVGVHREKVRDVRSKTPYYSFETNAMVRADLRVGGPQVPTESFEGTNAMASSAKLLHLSARTFPPAHGTNICANTFPGDLDAAR
jgi:hypothetical protein